MTSHPQLFQCHQLQPHEKTIRHMTMAHPAIEGAQAWPNTQATCCMEKRGKRYVRCPRDPAVQAQVLDSAPIPTTL